MVIYPDFSYFGSHPIAYRDKGLFGGFGDFASQISVLCRLPPTPTLPLTLKLPPPFSFPLQTQLRHNSMRSIVTVMKMREGWILCAHHREKCCICSISCSSAPSPGVHLPKEIMPRPSAFLCKKAALTLAPSKLMAACSGKCIGPQMSRSARPHATFFSICCIMQKTRYGPAAPCPECTLLPDTHPLSAFSS